MRVYGKPGIEEQISYIVQLEDGVKDFLPKIMFHLA